MYFFSLPGEKEKSLPTVRQDSKKKNKIKSVKRGDSSYFAFVFKEEDLVCFPYSVLENLLDVFHYFSEKVSAVFL